MRDGLKQFLQRTRESRGFTLLLAALISSIVLSIGASIYAIASQEVALSATGRDSQFAFYAADTAAECGLYWDTRSDKHPNTFATSTQSHPAQSLICDGQTSNLTIADQNANSATSTFELDLFNTYCADVTVSKTLDPNGQSEHTRIDSNGYSVSCNTLNNFPNAPALQRSVELQY